jgi:hypothetical protein
MCTQRAWPSRSTGYQHRASNLPGAPPTALELCQSAAGDSLIAHGTAHCLALEALAGVEAPPRAAALRALAQEMERAAMHLADLGALANDVAYLPGASHYGATRTLVINSLLLLCGSRFGRGLLAPGGLAVDPPPAALATVAGELATVAADLAIISGDLFESTTVLSRFERTGRVTPADALARAHRLRRPRSRVGRDVARPPLRRHRDPAGPGAPGGGGRARARARARRRGRRLLHLLRRGARRPAAARSARSGRPARASPWR